MKSVGDEVAVGDELVEIETDKANMIYESDVAGTLTEIVAEEGATLPIGEVIARVGERRAPRPGTGGAAREAAEPDGGEPEAPAASDPSPSQRRAPRRGGPETAAPSARRAPASALKASPVARRIAGERGVDLAG